MVTNVKQQTKDGIIDEVGAMLKHAYHAYADGLAPPEKKDEEKEFQRMATELMKDQENRQFALSNGHVVTIERFKEQYEPLVAIAQGKEKKKLESQLAMLDSIPTDKGADKAAEAVDRGVKKSTGFFNSFSGFFTTIGNLIATLFEWVVQLFKDGPKKGFWEIMGEKTEKSVRIAVGKELKPLEKDGTLTSAQVDKMLESVGDKAKKETMGTRSEEESAIKSTKMLSREELGLDKIQERILQGIGQTIDAQFATEDDPKTKEKEGVLREMMQQYVDKGKLKPDQIGEFQRTLQKVTENLVKDKETVELDDKELRQKIAIDLTNELEWGFGRELTLSSAIVGNGKPQSSKLTDEQLDLIRASANAYNGGKEPDIAVPQSIPKHNTQLASER